MIAGEPAPANDRPVITAGIFLGLGFGGFFDGIVLHQILQWHHMVTAQYPATTLENLELNTLFDGLFHAATYIFTLIGMFLLWRVLQRHSTLLTTSALVGSILMGWGIFNLAEGLVNHHILQIHHVRAGPNELLWDVGFLAWGAVMLLGGWWLSRTRRAAPAGTVTSAQD